MNPDQLIPILLHHYRDVCEGIYRDPQGEDDVGKDLMCATWNHPAYQELERLLAIMHERWPRLRQALRQRFERYEELRVAWCKRCGAHPAWHVGRIHSHPPGRSIALRPRVVRVYAEDARYVDDAIAFLEEHWQDVYSIRYRETSLVLPKLVAEIEAERSLRAA